MLRFDAQRTVGLGTVTSSSGVALLQTGDPCTEPSDVVFRENRDGSEDDKHHECSEQQSDLPPRDAVQKFASPEGYDNRQCTRTDRLGCVGVEHQPQPEDEGGQNGSNEADALVGVVEDQLTQIRGPSQLIHGPADEQDGQDEPNEPSNHDDLPSPMRERVAVSGISRDRLISHMVRSSAAITKVLVTLAPLLNGKEVS
jgi:hypothetical protein